MNVSLTNRTRRIRRTIDIGISVLTGLLALNHASGAGAVRDAIWVRDALYGTVGTPTAFKSAPAHSLDVIYSFDGSGLLGQRSIAEAAPGDPEYNGGRWQVMGVTATEEGLANLDVDMNGFIDEEITNADLLWELVASGDLEVSDTGVRFECPLLP